MRKMALGTTWICTLSRISSLPRGVLDILRKRIQSVEFLRSLLTHLIVLDLSRDLSVWCFLCEHYLDAQVIVQLRPVFETLHLMKFGEPAPNRTELRTADPVVLTLS